MQELVVNAVSGEGVKASSRWSEENPRE